MLRQVLVCAVLVVAVRGYHKHGTGSPTSTVAPTAGPSNAEPLIELPQQAGRVRGSWMESRRGRRFQAYRGIRYAEPPVGPLRFKPPVMIKKYREEVNATQDGPACPLLAPDTYYVDEDCLTINVYTPDNHPKKPLPVVFYIHAGGFYSMTGRSDVAGPHYLLDRDLVLVTINYRLGSLGFISTGDALAPGNNGMKDQVAALKWVQRNIAAFGGDPNLVTITGCSAGSISVMLHMISPMSKGLFHRGISMSASPVGKAPSPTDQYELAVKQAQLVNCPYDNSSVIMDCLSKKPWSAFRDWRGFYEFGFDPVGIWTIVVEPDFGQERFLTMDPLDAIKQGKMHEVPYIVSQTEDEFFWMAFTVTRNATLRETMNKEWERVAPISLMLPRDATTNNAVHRLRQYYLGNATLKDDEESGRKLGKMYGDSIIGFHVHRLVNLMCRYSSHPVWYYEFSYIGNHSHYEDPTTGKPLGAAHHDDLIYLFSLSYRYPTIEVSDNKDSNIVDKMTAIWYNFARYGDPNPRGDTSELSGLQWPRVTPHNRSYLRVADQLTIRQNLNEDRYQLWEELYPIQY